MKMAVLTASTGGGHNVRALALQQWVEKLGLGRAAAWFPLEETHLVYRFGVGLYNAIQRGSPLLHHGYFSFLELASLFRTPSRILGKGRS
jgi:processive 1,2-diacylglycerol beta-glucosyltransferase